MVQLVSLFLGIWPGLHDRLKEYVFACIWNWDVDSQVPLLVYSSVLEFQPFCLLVCLYFYMH